MKKNQTGFIMQMTLVFLVILLVITLSMLGSNLLKERMLGNTKDSNLAFQVAEACLRDAENDIIANILSSSDFSVDCVEGLCETGASFNWSDSGKVRTFGQYTSATLNFKVAKKPLYIIEKLPRLDVPPGESEDMGSEPPVSARQAAYRVTVQAVGAYPTTVVELQSIFYRPVK